MDGQSAGVRLSELMATLSFSTDLGFGQPMEHLLRSCLIALRLADRPGLDEAQRAETHWVTPLELVCTVALADLAAVASSHHERLDGSGYHRAARGSDIPLLSRYLAAAGVDHALV
jgi:hypothetical protein